MTPRLVSAALVAAAAACAGQEPAAAAAFASIVRVALPPEDQERQPFAVPTEPENTLEVDLPWPLEDWAGRGFTPDAEKYAGDFEIEASRGADRLFITPVAQGAHRVLHLVLAPTASRRRSLTLEFIAAPPNLAWRKVVFVKADEGEERPTPVTLSERPPVSLVRQASPESELGLLGTLRLLAGADAEQARRIAAANPALELAVLADEPRSFGAFTLTSRFALRDATTGALGLCISVTNPTGRRLLFDPASWIVRAADHVYPVGTVDFACEVEPGASQAALLVLASDSDGRPNRLLAQNDFLASVALAGTADPHPVVRLNLDGFAP